MQAKLNMHLGAEVFDRIFVGAEFNHAWQGVLYVRVRSEYSARQLTKKHVNLLASGC
jgi:hypothetical protein